MNFATFLISLITSDEADVLECPNLPSNEFYSWIIYELCHDIGKQHFCHWYTIYTWNMSFTITLSPMPCCVYGFLGANSSAKEKTSIGTTHFELPLSSGGWSDWFDCCHLRLTHPNLEIRMKCSPWQMELLKFVCILRLSCRLNLSLLSAGVNIHNFSFTPVGHSFPIKSNEAEFSRSTNGCILYCLPSVQFWDFPG